MTTTQIDVEVSDRIMTITLDRPDRLNAFTGVMMQEMIDTFDRADADDEVRAIIITGRGRVGGLVDRILSAAGHSTTVIDYSSQQLDALRKFGIKAYFGDATRPDLLKAAGIEDAKILVVAIDEKEQVDQIVHHVIQTYPHVHVIARAANRHHVYELWAAGCRDIIRETYDSSVRMGRSALEALGVERTKAQAMVDAFSAMDRRSMVEVADAYDLNIPPLENEAYIERVKEVLGPWQDELHKEMMEILNEGTDRAG
jgi:CPA2 family monovalent cation:H+ antiporter-2